MTLNQVYYNKQLKILCKKCSFPGFYDLVKNVWVCAKLLQTLCDPVDCSLQGSTVHGLPQARILEWLVMPSSRGIFPTPGVNLGLLCLLLFATSTAWENEQGRASQEIWHKLSSGTSVAKYVA